MEDGEKCTRCGEVGQDRRTLTMACFYNMSELEIPLEEKLISGEIKKCIGQKMVRFSDIGPHVPIPVWSDVTHKVDLPLFQMRVCKRCRADWMQAIRRWFVEGLIQEDEMPTEEANIPIRVLGDVKYITRAEWDKIYPDREPVTVKV